MIADEQRKQKRRIYGLRYRMRKKGYYFAGRENLCTMPDDDSRRSRVMERHASLLGFSMQYNLIAFLLKNGGVNSLFAVVCLAVSLLKI